jgi:hypothetical protein
MIDCNQLLKDISNDRDIVFIEHKYILLWKSIFSILIDKVVKYILYLIKWKNIGKKCSNQYGI